MNFRWLIHNWEQRLLALLIASALWVIVNYSGSTNKILQNIPVRIENLPPHRTIEGMGLDGFLGKKVSLSVYGNEKALSGLTGRDFEIVIDASDKENEWIETVTLDHLVCRQIGFDLRQTIARVVPVDLTIKQTPFITDKIPLFITHPIGEPLNGYQYFGSSPRQLSLTVTGPEKEVKRLQEKGVQLTFNLNDISKVLRHSAGREEGEELCFLVPDEWKEVFLPSLSKTPLRIDDPKAADLTLRFTKGDLIPLKIKIPIIVFYPLNTIDQINPQSTPLLLSEHIREEHSLFYLDMPLYVYGVSQIFCETIQNNLEIVIITSPKRERPLVWYTHIVSPQSLEEVFIAKMRAQEEARPGQNEYWRSLFHAYMKRLRLFTLAKKKLGLLIEEKEEGIAIRVQNAS